MIATIRRWGNSSAIRIPQHILSEVNLAEGSDLELLINEGEITLREVRKQRRYLHGCKL